MPRNRNILGLIAHNLLRHVDAQHSGQFNDNCERCRNHVIAFHNLSPYEMWTALTGNDIVTTQRKTEERNR